MVAGRGCPAGVFGGILTAAASHRPVGGCVRAPRLCPKPLQNGKRKVPPHFAVLIFHLHAPLRPLKPHALGCPSVWAASHRQAGQGLPELGWAQAAGQPGKTSGLGPLGSPFGGLEWLENLLEKTLCSF